MHRLPGNFCYLKTLSAYCTLVWILFYVRLFVHGGSRVLHLYQTKGQKILYPFRFRGIVLPSESCVTPSINTKLHRSGTTRAHAFSAQCERFFTLKYRYIRLQVNVSARLNAFLNRIKPASVYSIEVMRI